MTPVRTILARLRPVVAVVAAYAIALQGLFGGLAIGEPRADRFAADGMSIICLGDHGGRDEPAKPSDRHDSCWLCSVARSGHVVLPTGSSTPIVEARLLSILVPPRGGQEIGFEFPTGWYARGPPPGAAALA